MKITREIKTAILVIASILLFIWGYSFLQGRDILNSHRTFFVEYDNVEGLSTSAPVTINGLVVGKIMEINLMPTTGKLQVEIQVKNDFPISKSSTIDIYEPGLIGGKQIQIIPNLQDTEMAESGDTLKGRNVPGLTSVIGEKLAPLQEKIEKVAENANQLLVNLNQVLDDKSKANLRESIAKLNVLMGEFEKTSKNVNQIIDKNKSNIDGSLANLNKTTANFSKLSDTLANANIGQAIKNFENSLKGVDKIITNLEQGKGSMGKLLNDDQLYKNLNATSNELELLLQDLRLNPTRYINVSLFGKKNKPYVAPKPLDSISN
ncbi:MlaD family protein [Flavobacterium sp.]|uniref:MlaD family protein n=1 Tax=Flavobacterium sp. TaxID=239 RepID=UPI00262B2524|nr:MlaD family protein [Flavobacterium sp.]MDD3004079.1 MlaD family protein [Flavobacterium sp.]